MECRQLSLAALASVLVVVVPLQLAGCDSGTAAPQSIATKQRVNDIVEMRKIYDQVHGNWDGLTDTDRAQYVKLAGSQAAATKMWDRMGHPPGAPPPTAK